jgi:hypothetical protein
MATAAEHIQDDDKMTITAERVQVIKRLGLEHTTAHTDMQMLGKNTFYITVFTHIEVRSNCKLHRHKSVVS